MTDEKHDEPERTPLDDWGATWKAPASLRHRTLDAARERGLIGGTPMRFDRRFLWAAAAAAALTFAIGFGLGVGECAYPGRAPGRHAGHEPPTEAP
jgi:hypothetical protein